MTVCRLRSEIGRKINIAECLHMARIFCIFVRERKKDMSEKNTIFQTPEFGNIRTMRDEKCEPLFCLKDVCEVLDLRTQKVVQ